MSIVTAVLQDKAAAVAAPSITESSISFIIPVLNDCEALKRLLPALQEYRKKGHEVLIVDGGSTDGSIPFARSMVDRILMTGTGRGRQMNLGAENACHNILFFLHADSQLPPEIDESILVAIKNNDRHWGRFDIKLDETGFVYDLIAYMMNLRSRWSGVATGDQGIFVRKNTFHEVGGFEDIPLMEDVALSKSLRKVSWPVCLKCHITTSSRRWKNQGVVKTILLMWRLRLAYFCGVNPQKLARVYYPPVKTKSNKRALILFARSPVLGQVKSRLVKALGEEGTLRLYRQMLRQQIALVENIANAKKEIWVAGDAGHTAFKNFGGQLKTQTGNDLGERMHNAFQEILEQSDKAILIGSDCPDLSRQYIERAFHYLDAGEDVVLGPARDGGYVLIGLTTANKELFHDIDWGTDQVLAQTRLRMKAQNLSWKELEPIQDIDEPEDLFALGKEYSEFVTVKP